MGGSSIGVESRLCCLSVGVGVENRLCCLSVGVGVKSQFCCLSVGIGDIGIIGVLDWLLIISLLSSESILISDMADCWDNDCWVLDCWVEDDCEVVEIDWYEEEFKTSSSSSDSSSPAYISREWSLTRSLLLKPLARTAPLVPLAPLVTKIKHSTCINVY